MKLTWYGTATVGLDDGETKLLFDPFVRMNRRLETTPVEGFAGFDAVLVTHGHLNHKMPENGEIVAYEITHGDKRIFLTGSFRDTPEITYPKDVDLLVLANGGSVFVPEKTKGFLRKYTPKAILVDHFDNAFPPVTRNVSVKRLQRTVKKNHPEIRFIVPEIRKEIEI